jgi:hypothetical protein
MTMDYRKDDEEDPPPKGWLEFLIWLGAIAFLWLYVVPAVEIGHQPTQIGGTEEEEEREDTFVDWVISWVEL